MKKITITDMENGYVEQSNQFLCLYCAQSYHTSFVYPDNENLANAEFMIKKHLNSQHGGAAEALLQLDKNESGLTDIQKHFLSLVNQGLSDEQIAEKMTISKSAVRNHRFKLKEKRRQATTLIALLNLLDDSANEYEQIAEQIPRLTLQNSKDEKIIATFLDKHGHAIKIPTKEKKRIILFRKLMERFLPEKHYTEAEVNQTISTMFDDHVTVRRYLIEYGMLGRTIDGKKYWVI
ncbi:DUF2087 domain-containing protein [Candidatus Enterococcus clewellii]|uniref:HTH luxR-type domain-containing protein n=1 Tax=Candidatus Enterococcus clewellii TaxID=1834193 RepID=A0A242K6A1_9ENTE|nr:DUF2087 domain-containing protein [Enterococcus sp. 9E7_DIV0242]OTP15734.1 hypothetical protein A5888_001948 [Enterococcus sp. 9E7_DIV0242]